MKFILQNGHVLVDFDGWYVVDTGSPSSFNFYNKKSIDIEEKTFNFSTPLIANDASLR